MGAKVSFDPITRVISLTEAPVGGFASLDVKVDLYSDGKEDWLADPALNKLEFPFTTIGGQDLGSGLTAGAYFFLRNDLGWRIQPYSDDHELTVNGNLYATDTNQPIWTPATGTVNVQIRLNTSSLTQQVAGLLGNDALADISWLRRRLEGNETRDPTLLTVRDKDTDEVLLQKTVTGGNLTSTISFTEAP